jgi:uncharacterized membrane protein
MEKKCMKRVKVGVLVALSVLVAVTVAFGFNLPGLSKFETVKPVNGVVTVPTAKVSDGTAHYFRLEEAGKEIKFFLIKGKDGAIHTAFDACDVCYKAKLGYVQEGDKMVCKKCSQKFPVVEIGAQSEGGCNPSYLPAKADATSVRINLADLKAGARFF